LHIAYFHLNNYDAAVPWHREFKAYLGQRWELIHIENFSPVKTDQSTKCTLRKWTPMTLEDEENVFPSSQSLLNNTQFGTNDLKYSPMKGLWTDIPK
jgi:hypothetical protein